MAFPNPCSDRIQFEWERELRDVKYTVYAFTGESVAQGQVNNRQLTLDTKGWSSGSYFIALTHAQGTRTATFQVVRAE